MIAHELSFVLSCDFMLRVIVLVKYSISRVNLIKLTFLKRIYFLFAQTMVVFPNNSNLQH